MLGELKRGKMHPNLSYKSVADFEKTQTLASHMDAQTSLHRSSFSSMRAKNDLAHGSSPRLVN
jgi:hypothetical protein